MDMGAIGVDADYNLGIFQLFWSSGGDTMVLPKPIEEQLESERLHERIRQTPGVIVHRTANPVPYIPWIRVVDDVNIRELLGRDDDDQFDRV